MHIRIIIGIIIIIIIIKYIYISRLLFMLNLILTVFVVQGWSVNLTVVYCICLQNEFHE